MPPQSYTREHAGRIAERVRGWIAANAEATGESLNALARRCGVRVQLLQGLVGGGKAGVTADQFARLAVALGVKKGDGWEALVGGLELPEAAGK